MNFKSIFISLLSLIRIPLAFSFLYFLYNYNLKAAFIILLIAALSDKLDGTLARRLGLGGMLWGKIFDPLGDRTFMVISFTALALFDLPIKPSSIVLYLTIGQDLILAPIGIFVFLKKRRAFTSPIGKVTTFFQFLFLILLMMINLHYLPHMPMLYLEIPLIILNLSSGAHHIYIWLLYKRP